MALKAILTVDRNPRNLELLGQFLQKEGYMTLPVSTLENFKAVLDQAEDMGLALVDISGFDRSIWAYYERLSDRGVPLMIISPRQIGEIQKESIMRGARGVLFKPLVVKELIKIVRKMLLQGSKS